MLPENHPYPIRYLCTGCGAWREGDAQRLITGLYEGYPPGSPEAAQIAKARQVEMPFMARHIKTCYAVIRAIHPETKEWDLLDPKKREN